MKQSISHILSDNVLEEALTKWEACRAFQRIQHLSDVAWAEMEAFPLTTPLNMLQLELISLFFIN